MAKIFISYRREDSQWPAHSLYNEIRPHVENPDEDIFIDVDNIPLGVNFAEYLDQKVSQCEIVLVLIGQGWLNAKNAAGERRLEDPNDFVRIEVASALARGIPVVPILLDGADVPTPDLLPENMRELSMRNGVEVRRTSFKGDVARLINGLRLGPKPRDFGNEEWQVVSQSLDGQRYEAFASNYPSHARALEATQRATILEKWGEIDPSNAESILEFRKKNQDILARFERLDLETKARFEQADKVPPSAPSPSPKETTSSGFMTGLVLVLGAVFAGFYLHFDLTGNIEAPLSLWGLLPVLAAYAGLSSQRSVKTIVALMCLISAPALYITDALRFGSSGLPIALSCAVLAWSNLRAWRRPEGVSLPWILASVSAMIFGAVLQVGVNFTDHLSLSFVDVGLFSLGVLGLAAFSGLSLRSILAIVFGTCLLALLTALVLEQTDPIFADGLYLAWARFQFGSFSLLFALIAATCTYYALRPDAQKPRPYLVYTLAFLGLFGAFLRPNFYSYFDPILLGHIGDHLLYGTAMAQEAAEPVSEVVVTGSRRVFSIIPILALVIFASAAIGTTLRQQGAESPLTGYVLVTLVFFLAVVFELALLGQTSIVFGMLLTSLLSTRFAFTAPWRKPA